MHSLLEHLRLWHERNQDRQYLSGLSEPDWVDLGLTPADAAELLDGRADTRERMLAMASRFGLDAKAIDADRQSAVDMALACGRCGATRVCAHYLAGEGNADPHAFCPNAARYSEMGS